MKRIAMLVGLLVGVAGLALAQADGESKTWVDVLQYAATVLPAIIAAAVVGIRNWPELIRSKTFWTGVSAIIAAAQQYIAGNIDPPTFVFGVLAGLALIFVRDAQATASKAAEAAADPSRRI